jgi:hypothetical protein
MNAFLTRKKFDQLITEHNSICNDIKSYDQFWKKYTFALTYSLIPINLMAIHELFFEELPLATFGTELNSIIGLLVSHILLKSPPNHSNICSDSIIKSNQTYVSKVRLK